MQHPIIKTHHPLPAGDAHTPEPWLGSPYPGMIVAATPPGPKSLLVAWEEGGWVVAESASKANRERILACINACAGIPTEELLNAYSGSRVWTLDRLASIAQRASIKAWTRDFPNDPYPY